MKSRTQRPIIMAIYTRIERSLLLITPISPVKKEAIPQIPAITIGTASKRLLKNVAPPRCPVATSIWKSENNTMKVKINRIDHFPDTVFGIKYTFTA